MTDIFSLQRFMYKFKHGKLSGRVRLGGRYLKRAEDAGRAYLVDGDCKIEIPVCDYLVSGDLAVLTLETGDNLEPTSSIQGGLKLLKVVEQQKMFTPKSGLIDEADSQIDSTSVVRKTNLEIQLWSQFLFQIRSYFHSQNLTEATTPSLVVNPGMEPELEPFATTWRHGSQLQTYFLPTSPELHLKKLMARGFTDLFEIKTVYRNEEKTPMHEPEFTMLEWYRGYADLQMIESDFMGLLNSVASCVFGRDEHFKNLKKIKVADFFQDLFGFTLKPQTTKQELFDLAEKLKLHPSIDLSWNDLFHLIWVSEIDEKLPQEPFLLTDYPPSQAALAKINAEGWADRFEFYWDGIEIANAFNELTDAKVQRERFERDQIMRIQYGRTPLDIDEEFMHALEIGLPPSGGIAVGLDRLFKRFLNTFVVR